VSIYERRDFKIEVGASISCAANGGQWLKEWGVDVAKGKPVNLMKLVMRDWDTGKILNQYNLDAYEKEWGVPYYMFHRQDMHAMLLDVATSVEGEGEPATVVVDHIAKTVDHAAGTVEFENGNVVTADIIIGADGIRVSCPKVVCNGTVLILTHLSLWSVGKSESSPTRAPPTRRATAATCAPRTSKSSG
jgi:salicylate hydroxylase